MGPNEQAGILGWAGEGGELGLPSRAPDNLLSFQGPGAGGDTGVDGWGLAPAHSRGCWGSSLQFPCVPFSSSPPACPLGCGLRLRPLPAPPGSRFVCVSAGWRGADPRGGLRSHAVPPPRAEAGAEGRVKGAGGVGGGASSGGLRGAGRIPAPPSSTRGAGTDAASAEGSLPREAAGDRGGGGPARPSKGNSVRELTCPRDWLRGPSRPEPRPLIRSSGGAAC